MLIEERIALVLQFRDDLMQFMGSRSRELRSKLNMNMRGVRREVIEAGCFKTLTIAPPPAVGGLLMSNVDPFNCMFDAPYGHSLNPMLVDMLEETVGVMRAPDYGIGKVEAVALAEPEVQKGFLFIAMPMAGDKPEYDDVQDAIKAAARDCGLHAERVDDVQSNERITDRLLESIRRAEYVVADLTDGRPNVFYEAGYAYGLGKTPIYVARAGTNIEFDLKDYPVIFFSSMRQLRDGLEKRLRGISGVAANG